MKKKLSPKILLTPAAAGWQLHRDDQAPQPVSTLAEAAPLIPVDATVNLALPACILVLERLTLPSTEREELAGMVRLQSEKSLPFTMEEVSSDFVMVASRPPESAVLSVAVPHAPFEALCQPLRERHIVPERATPFVFHVAAACPVDEAVLVVYAEQQQLVVAIVESTALSWAHVLPSTDVERFVDDLPQLLLPAMMEGVPTTFSHVFLAEDCSDLGPALREFFELTTEPLPAVAPSLTQPINLVPPSWQDFKIQQQRGKRLQERLLIVAALGLVAAVAAMIYLAVLKRQSARLEAQLAALRPKVELTQARQARAKTLAAAIDPHRFTTELLHLLVRHLPSDGVRLTEFDRNLDQWRVVGEAPSASLASDYISRIKTDKDLEAYEITADPPRMLSNEHWQFNISGKQ